MLPACQKYCGTYKGPFERLECHQASLRLALGRQGLSSKGNELFSSTRDKAKLAHALSRRYQAQPQMHGTHLQLKTTRDLDRLLGLAPFCCFLFRKRKLTRSKYEKALGVSDGFGSLSRQR